MAKNNNFKIGDKALRANRSVEPMRWVEVTMNQTYLELAKECPEDFRPVYKADRISPDSYRYRRWVMTKTEGMDEWHANWLKKKFIGPFFGFERMKREIDAIEDRT